MRERERNRLLHLQDELEMKPQHEHDCSHCTLLGVMGGDWYHCASDMSLGTIIERNSSDPSDYSSFDIESIDASNLRDNPIAWSYRAWRVAQVCGITGWLTGPDEATR